MRPRSALCALLLTTSLSHSSSFTGNTGRSRPIPSSEVPLSEPRAKSAIPCVAAPAGRDDSARLVVRPLPGVRVCRIGDS